MASRPVRMPQLGALEGLLQQLRQQAFALLTRCFEDRRDGTQIDACLRQAAGKRISHTYMDLAPVQSRLACRWSESVASVHPAFA